MNLSVNMALFTDAACVPWAPCLFIQLRHEQAARASCRHPYPASLSPVQLVRLGPLHGTQQRSLLG